MTVGSRKNGNDGNPGFGLLATGVPFMKAGRVAVAWSLGLLR